MSTDRDLAEAMASGWLMSWSGAGSLCLADATPDTQREILARVAAFEADE